MLTAIFTITLAALVFWFLTHSDDDDSEGGLMEPALIPIPIKKGLRKKNKF